MKNFFSYVGFFLIFFITSVFAGIQYIDFSEYDFRKNPSKKINTLRDRIGKNAKGLLGLGLTNNKLNSATFEQLTNELDPSQYINLQVLDISDNQIDENAASSLAKWLCLESKPYIKLTGTPVALKYIGRLYDAFNVKFPEKVRRFMKRIIFVTRDYVKRASEEVQIYKTLVRNRKIPKSWGNIHNIFYRGNIYFNLLLDQKKMDDYQFVENSLKSLSLSSPSTASESASGVDSATEDENGDALDFAEALKTVSPPRTPTHTPTSLPPN